MWDSVYIFCFELNSFQNFLISKRKAMQVNSFVNLKSNSVLLYNKSQNLLTSDSPLPKKSPNWLLPLLQSLVPRACKQGSLYASDV